MKRIYLLLITLIGFGQTISAQNDKKLLKMTFGESYFELKYDEKGRIIESVEYIADDHLKRSSKYAIVMIRSFKHSMRMKISKIKISEQLFSRIIELFQKK